MGRIDVVLVEGARALANEKEVRMQLVGGTDHIPNSFNVSTTTQSPCVPSPALISFQRFSSPCSGVLCSCWSSFGILLPVGLSSSGILPRCCLILSLESRFPLMPPSFSRGSDPPDQGSLHCSVVGEDESCGSGALELETSSRNLAQTMYGLGRLAAA